MIRLKLLVGNDPRPRDLAGETITIGRSSTNHLAVPDPWMSRLHARIERAGARVRLVDLSSGNGTRWKGGRIDAAFLEVGDILEIGRTRLSVLRVEAADETTTVRPAVPFRRARPRKRRLSAV